MRRKKWWVRLDPHGLEIPVQKGKQLLNARVARGFLPEVPSIRALIFPRPRVRVVRGKAGSSFGPSTLGMSKKFQAVAFLTNALLHLHWSQGRKEVLLRE